MAMAAVNAPRRTGETPAAIRKRWLMSNFETNVLKGAYWAIGSVTASYAEKPEEGYSKALVDQVSLKSEPTSTSLATLRRRCFKPRLFGSGRGNVHTWGSVVRCGGPARGRAALRLA